MICFCFLQEKTRRSGSTQKEVRILLKGNESDFGLRVRLSFFLKRSKKRQPSKNEYACFSSIIPVMHGRGFMAKGTINDFLRSIYGGLIMGYVLVI